MDPINTVAVSDTMLRAWDMSPDMTAQMLLNSWFGMGYIMFNLAIYVFFAYCQYTLSKKLNIQYSWMAFVPVLNIFNLVKIAGLSYWWILGLFIPFWNIYAIIKILHGISINTWHGGGWTVWLFFLYFIFFPITALIYVPVTTNNPNIPVV